MRSIFISSTFADMQKERDIIQEKIRPVLDSFARKNGDSVRVEDLRWGIDTSKDDSSVNILNLCFDAILETNPLMIALIGDRYGTMVDAEIVKTSMLNRKEKIAEPAPGSITELELKYAMALNPSQIPCLFFFREVHIPDSLEKEAPEIWSIYRESDEKAKENTERLKKTIEKLYPERVFKYEISWDPVKKELVGWEGFEELVKREMKAVLRSVLGYSDDINRSAYDLARLNFAYSFQQDALPVTSGQCFTHNRWQLRCLMSRDWCKRIRGYWIRSEDQFESSVLLASVAHKWMQEGKNIIPFDCGISKDTYSFFFFVMYICRSLACRLGKEERFRELHDTVYLSEYGDGSDCDEVLEYWLELYEAEGKEDVIIVVRNWHLTDYEDIQYWYPCQPGSGRVHWVFSSTGNISWDGETIYYNRKIAVHDEGFFDHSFVIDSYMQKNHKQLAKTVKNSIIDRAAGKPLSYLMILLDRLLRMNERDYDIIRSYGLDGNAINKHQSHLIREMQNDRNHVINAAVLSLKEETGRGFVTAVLSIAAVVPYPIPAGYLKYLLEGHGIGWNSMDYFRLKNRLASVLQDNIEDALYFKDASFGREWRNTHKEETEFWERRLIEDSLDPGTYGAEEKYYREYCENLKYGSETDQRERIAEAASYIVPRKMKYFPERMELCGKRFNEAETPDEQLDESVHYAFLELNQCRELAVFGVDIWDRSFVCVSTVLKNLAFFCDRADAGHAVSELLDYYRECRENRSEERAQLAKDMIGYICRLRAGEVPEELMAELRENSVIG